MRRSYKFLLALSLAGSITLGTALVTNGFANLSISADAVSYTLTVTAEDLLRGYAVTSGGAQIAFETSKVNEENGAITFQEGGHLRFTDPINGSTRFAIAPASSWGEEKIVLSSGYGLDAYGAATYLDASHLYADTYYRTFFELSSEANGVALNSITVNYSCQTHYEFTPIMETITQDVDYDELATYPVPTYEDDIAFNPDEVDLVMENNTIQVDSQGDPIYTLHPIAKYFDKGGCLIKQATGLWIVHVNPIIRFFTGVNESIDFTYTIGSYFNLNKLNSGKLSSFDWSAYTGEDGVLTKPLQQSLNLYPKVTMHVNPGVNSPDGPSEIVFTPNPNAENFGFPSVPAPNVNTGYHFTNWYNADEVYKPAEARDFHDYDLIAVYSSDFDLRLRFRNRGFDSPYFEVGIPEGNDYDMSQATSLYVDQSTTGLEFASDKGYFVYPEGNRSAGQLYASNAFFENDGKGTSLHPSVYIAEPFSYQAKDNNGIYTYGNKRDHNGVYGYDILGYTEYGPGDRSYRRSVALPDYVQEDKKLTGRPFSTGDYSPDNPSAYDANNAKGITSTKELETLIGNDAFYRVGSSGFSNNESLRELEFFPNLTELDGYAFYKCHNLKPIQEWKDAHNFKTIGTHAFDQCYDTPLYDAQGQRLRRRIEIPKTVTYIGGVAFGGTSQTDFDFDPNKNFSHDSLWRRPFAYDATGGHGADSAHSPEFAEVLKQWREASDEVKPTLVPTLKLFANRVLFHGTKAQWEALYKNGSERADYQYDDAEMLNQLINNEFYVVFLDD